MNLNNYILQSTPARLAVDLIWQLEQRKNITLLPLSDNVVNYVSISNHMLLRHSGSQWRNDDKVSKVFYRFFVFYQFSLYIIDNATIFSSLFYV